MVEKRKKLSLTDSTIAQLKALEEAIRERNKVALAVYDSVRKRIMLSGDAAASDVQIAQRDQASVFLKEQDDEFGRLSSRSGSGGQEQ